MKTYTSKEKNVLEVKETVEETKTLNYDFLLSQREQILKDIERVNAELTEVDTMIFEAKKLGMPEAEKLEIIE